MSQKRYAYLIGANGPPGMQLKHAEQDVIRLADALKGPYCQFTYAEVVIARSRQEGLRGFKQFTERCDPSDLLLVHFSGHASFDEQLYLWCNNTDVNDLYSTALDINTIKIIMRKSKARYKVLFLDCCHAAGAHGGVLKGEQDIKGILHETVQGSAIAILSACSRKARTRELDNLDGGSGFLSWAIRAGCTTRLQEASSFPDLHVLSLDDLWKRWIPKALKEVNTTISRENPLPPPILLSELECGYGEIWLTDPPSNEQESHSRIDEIRKKYLESVYSRYSSITLPIGQSEGFSLQAIFQPLSLRRNPLTAEDLERKQRRHLLGEQLKVKDELTLSPIEEHKNVLPSGMKQIPKPIIAENGEDALSKSAQRRIVVLGGPGTGKTTTIKHLVSQQSLKALSDPTKSVPIFLSLADLARSGKTLQSYLIDVVEDMGIEKSYADILWKEIERGHAFVGLDSLDEVDPGQRTRMIDLVNSRAAETGNTWLVGSRFTEYKGGQFKSGQFAEWELLPMTPQLRRELAVKLLPELYLLLSPSQISSSSPSTFVELLEKHSRAAAWGENPLLFSLAAVAFVKTGGLPPSRATLYRDVIESVLTMREPDSITRKHLFRILTGLALWLHKTKGRTFTSDDLLTFLEDIQQRSWEETENIAKSIITSGILDVVARDTYGFRHQTFQEYLAAVELAKGLTSKDPSTSKGAWEFAWSKRTYSRWTEILRLMVGVLAQLPEKQGRSVAVNWLNQLIAQRLTTEGDPGDLGLMLTVQSLVEVAEMAEWGTAKAEQLEMQVVLVWIHELLNTVSRQSEAREKRFQSLIEDIAHLRGYGIDRVVEQLVEALRNINMQDLASDTLLRLAIRIPVERLLAMLQDPNASVREAAVQALGSLRERVPIEPLLAMLQDPDARVREVAVQVLGGLGERVPVDTILQLLYKEDVDLRQTAIKNLEMQEYQIPIESLVELLGDEDKTIRSTTIRILKKVAPGVLVEMAPQALTVLRGELIGMTFSLLADKYAVDTISQLGLASSELLEELTELLNRPNWQVRVKAIRALIQLRRNIPNQAIERLLQFRFETNPKMCSVREAADDALAEILSLETGIEDE